MSSLRSLEQLSFLQRRPAHLLTLFRCPSICSHLLVKMAHDNEEGGFVNEISRYQELEQIEGVTLYEIERKPFPKVPEHCSSQPAVLV